MSGFTFDKLTLDNGLTIIGERNARAQSVALGYFVNTGSRDETPEVAGVSHFLEHMMFKGSDKRSPEDINREFDELGANYNAYTNEERTVYYGAVLSERAPKLLDLLTDMMRPALRQTDFDMEKNVILEEIAMYEDRPNFKAFELGGEQFYNGHPAGNSVLGSAQSITDLTSEQMRSYSKSRYAPDNMVLALAGNYDWDALVAQVEAATADWRAAGAARVYPALKARAGQDLKPDAKLSRAHVAMFAPGVSAQDELRYAASLVASCLGDSSGSRLYWELVDKGLADSASLSHDSSDQVGAFVGYLSTAPERVDEVLARYREVLLSAEAEGLRKDEWERAQGKLATAITLRAETPFGRLMPLGAGYLYDHSYRSVEDTLEALFKASLEDGQQVLAARPFSELFSMVLSKA